MLNVEAHAEVMEGVQFVARAPKLMQILDAVSAVYMIGKKDLMMRTRLKNVCHARQDFYWLARHLSTRSLEQIGMFLNGRHHTTVMYGVDRVSREFDQRKLRLIQIMQRLGIDTARLVELSRRG